MAKCTAQDIDRALAQCAENFGLKAVRPFLQFAREDGTMDPAHFAEITHRLVTVFRIDPAERNLMDGTHKYLNSDGTLNAISIFTNYNRVNKGKPQPLPPNPPRRPSGAKKRRDRERRENAELRKKWKD